ncbi:MAG TPA: glycosyltransferase family 2 protein [Azonexus sp.]
MNSPSLSLCMIVRNEAGVLPRFLASTAGLAEHFVVVDTGSSDGSQALLAAAGAEVIEIPWPDDFARARNVALEHARGDWVLVLDADEFPGPGFAAELRQLLAAPAIGAATINIASLQPNGGRRSSHLLRLFPRDPALRYRYRIHEDIAEPVLARLARTGQRLGQLKTPVEHIGYTPGQLAGKDKQARDERLLRLAIADDPADLYARFKLMELYRLWGQREAWQGEARQCLERLAPGAAIRPPHIVGELLDLVRIGVFGEAIEPGRQFLLEREALAGHDPHYRLALGGLHEQAGDLAAALDCYRATLAQASRHPARTLLETRGLMGLARLSLAIGDLASAREFTAATAELSPDDPEVRTCHQLLEGRRWPQ